MIVVNQGLLLGSSLAASLTAAFLLLLKAAFLGLSATPTGRYSSLVRSCAPKLHATTPKGTAFPRSPPSPLPGLQTLSAQ